MATELRPYKVYLKPGSLLTNLKDKKNSEITRGIYVFVLETDPQKRDLFIVYDKDMKPIYETSALNIVEIKKDISILPDIDAETIYPAPSELKANNKNAFFDTQFNLHLEFMNPATFNSLYFTEFTNTLGNRFEVRTLYNSELPVNFGLAMSYQTATWSNEEGLLKLSALSFGPQLQHYIHEEDSFAVSFIFGAEYSPIYKTSTDEFTDKYHAVLLNFGTEFLWQNYLGKWSAGIHLRRHDLNLISSTRSNISFYPEDITLNSIGAMLGYVYEWDL